jgi:superfamily II DNA or RNA helicase
MLQPLVELSSPWEALAKGQLSGREQFVATLTLERLVHPPARIAHSFATARTRFYPYQFKPLLKFLEHPGKRLLIADDVGLGKTIEAGYILRELDAIRTADRVLVLAPARLATKWKGELETKFEERFDKVRGRDLLAQAQRVAAGQEADPFRWIVSYESVRSEDIREQLQKTQFPIDILIADEAHRMRNPESLQHKIGAVLSTCADAAIFLTATPVMNKMEDLWQLLKLLSPGEFAIWEVFRARIDTNRFILAAQRALATKPPDMITAQEQIERFMSRITQLGSARGEFLSSVLERLRAVPATNRELIELQADVGRLSPVGHVVSRTRKADAIPDRPERVAHWQAVDLSPIETEIYQSVASLCREAGIGGSSGWGFEMGLLMAYRAVASCIPAAIDYFADKLRTTGAVELEDFEEEGESVEANVTPWSGSVRKRFKEIVDLYHSEDPPDSKLSSLVTSLNELWHDDDKHERTRRKVVVFSFFRGTLNYLTRKLDHLGIQNRMIHGGISIPDREVAVDQFLVRNDVPVLLSSEVGGEGIDLIAASVVINYDLPWNPMVVEQRIGRVDRIGQEAKRIIVRNLVVRGSVEERVLSRLLTKIAIFLQTIGDLEPIVGEQIEKLTAQVLRGELTEEEIEQRIEQQSAVLEQAKHDAEQMLSEADGLLAADQAMVNEIEALIGERQVPSQDEVFLFLNRFLRQFYPGSQLPLEAVSEMVGVQLSTELAVDMQTAGYELGSDMTEFGRRIATGKVELTLSREVSYRRSLVQFIHLEHPLCRFIVWKLKQNPESAQTAFRLCISGTKLPAGPYAFLIASVDIQSLRPVTRLVCILTNRITGEICSDPDRTTPVLVAMLREAEGTSGEILSKQECDALETRLQQGLQRLLAEWESREQALDYARQERLSAAQASVLQFRRQRAEERLESLGQANANDFSMRMAQAKLAIAEREEKEFLTRPPIVSWKGIVHHELAVGLLYISPENPNA